MFFIFDLILIEPHRRSKEIFLQMKYIVLESDLQRDKVLCSYMKITLQTPLL